MVFVAHERKHLSRFQFWFFWFIIHSKDWVRFTTAWVFTWAFSWDWDLISQSSRYWWSLSPLERAINFTSFTIIVKTWGLWLVRMGGRWTGTPVTCSKTLGISLSLGGWGCVGKRPTNLSTILIPLESGRSWWTLEFPFWTFVCVEKCWVCLSLLLASTLVRLGD